MTETLTRSLQVGLIGAGIGKSLTPAMHMREGQLQGLDYAYELLDFASLGVGPEALPSLIAKAEAKGFAGLNITHPCKRAAIDWVDELSSDAEILQSINTIVFANGRRLGHNTDWFGFAESFRRWLPEARLDAVVQLGAGGAGIAVAHAIALLGARHLTIFDIDPIRAEALADQLGRRHPHCVFVAGQDLPSAMAKADGLAHATPTGMASYPGLPLDPDLLHAKHWVAEIVYFPLETALLKAARERGCRTLDGGGMAVFQAVRAFELFTGATPDAERMTAHFKELAGEGKGAP
jgi:shikimate dehydrogenase